MHDKVLARTEPPRTWLERFDPRVKIAAVLVWTVAIVSLPAGSAAALAGEALVLLGLLLVGYAHVGKFTRRVAAALPLIMLLVVLLPFFKEGHALWQNGTVAITREGLAAAGHVGARALLCVSVVCLLWATTPEADLISGLRGLGLPALFVGVIAFMLRYLHVLRPELHRLWDARAARTIGRRTVRPLQSATNLLGAFFLRSHGRAMRVAEAMAARGYDGTWIVARQPRLPARDALLGTALAALVLALRWST